MRKLVDWHFGQSIMTEYSRKPDTTEDGSTKPYYSNQHEFIINFRLILPKFHSFIRRFFVRSIGGNKVTYFSVKTLSMAILLCIIFAPTLTHAGFFSFLSEVFTTNSEAFSSESKQNSQTIALLEAPVSSSLSVGGGDVEIVDQSAIAPAIDSAGGIGADAHFSNGQISLYVVRKGDSLSQIAKMFGVSVNTILWANDLSKATISEGQTLVILPITGVSHTVKQGDTIESIAKKYKSDAEEIRLFNELAKDAKLSAGDIVIVPDGEIAKIQPKVDAYSKSVPPSSYGSSKNPLPNRSVADGYFIRPIVGGRKTQGIHGYNGVDLAAPVGTPLIASASGKVIVAKTTGWNGGYGMYVVIAHSNGTQTLYAHMSLVSVYAGMDVVQGQVIGKVGSTGKSTGPHVHFEIRGAKNPF